MSNAPQSRVPEILCDAGIPIQPQPPPDFKLLVESDSLASPYALKGLDAFRRFLRLPPDSGARRPSREFWDAFLGNGQAAAEALLDRFAETMPETDADRQQKLAGILLGPRLAKGRDLIAWNLDSWRPPRDRTERVGLYLSQESAETARVAAFTLGGSLSSFVETAIAEKAARLREEGTELAARPRSSRRPRTRRRATA